MTRPAHQTRTQGSPAGSKVGFDDRLLAESVRALEHDGARPIDAPDADDRAATAGGDFETRIIARARALPVADRLEEALRNTSQIILVILGIVLLVAALAGAAAAGASLARESDGVVNIFWAMGGLLGIQTVLLAAWCVVMVKAPAALSGVSLGGVTLATSRRLAGRWHRTAESAAAIEAMGAVSGRGAIGRWTLGSISHAVWFVFNISCILLIVLMLSARHYRFVWETTILNAETYSVMTRGIAWLPSRLGFPAPTPEQIAASDGSLRPDDSEAARHAWSGLLVGSVVTYGLAPRVALLALCLWRLGCARRRFRLDTTRPGYLRLRPGLMPRSQSLGVIDPETDDEGGLEPVQASSSAPSSHDGGAPAVLGMEIDPPATAWPPSVGNVAWRDLGFVDGRNDRQRVLSALGDPGGGPSVTVVVCGLTTTPDRGIASFLRDVRQASGARMAMVLTGGDALRKRGNGAQLATRIDDWRTLAGGIGLAGADVIELDLDHLTDASAARLASLVGAEGIAPPAGRRIEDAFAAIVDHARRWPAAPAAPDFKQQSALHDAIGKLYRAEMTTWGQRLRLPDAAGLKKNLAQSLEGGARQVVALLPPRLKADTRWVAAGAVAGALGCVTAAALLSPVAIAALPLWSALGAAVTAVVRATVSGGVSDEDLTAADSAARADAVRAAALLALLLELQGRDEAAISSILDKALDEPAEPELDTQQNIQRYLDGLRHRLDLALAGGSSS